MKKIVFVLSLFISALFLTLTMTQPVFAAHTSGWDIVKDTTYPDRYYLTENGSRDIVNDEKEVDIDFEFEGLNNVIGFKFYYQYSPTVTHQLISYSGEFGVFKASTIRFYYDYVEIEELYTNWTKDGSHNGDQENQFYFSDFVFAAPADTHRPAITGEENFAVSVDDPKSVDYFKGFLMAYDETDGDITSEIYLVNDNYTTNQHVKGTYNIEFGVSDVAGNISTLIVKVTVADVTKPVISGNSTKVQISYTQTFNVATFKTTLVATDNYDTMTNANIILESDGYTSNKTSLGTYNIVFKLTDASGNFITFIKQVEVIDDIAPTWAGPTSINKPSISILTVNDIKAQLSATDEKEGNVNASIIAIEDNYTGKGSVVGSYTIIFEVKDSKNNKSTRTVTVIVQDNLPPIWFIQDGVSIKLVPPTFLTQQQIVDLIIATGQIEVTSTMQLRFTVDNYTGNEDVPGVYMMTLAYSDTNGNEGEHELSLTVLGDEDEDPIIVSPDNNILQTITKWFDDSMLWVQQNYYLALGILSGVILLGLGLFSVFGKKR